jgi:hypothetical protein
MERGYDRASRVEIRSETGRGTGWWPWRGGVDVKGSKACDFSRQNGKKRAVVSGLRSVYWE